MLHRAEGLNNDSKKKKEYFTLASRRCRLKRKKELEYFRVRNYKLEEEIPYLKSKLESLNNQLLELEKATTQDGKLNANSKNPVILHENDALRFEVEYYRSQQAVFEQFIKEMNKNKVQFNITSQLTRNYNQLFNQVSSILNKTQKLEVMKINAARLKDLRVLEDKLINSIIDPLLRVELIRGIELFKMDQVQIRHEARLVNGKAALTYRIDIHGVPVAKEKFIQYWRNFQKDIKFLENMFRVCFKPLGMSPFVSSKMLENYSGNFVEVYKYLDKEKEVFEILGEDNNRIDSCYTGVSTYITNLDTDIDELRLKEPTLTLVTQCKSGENENLSDITFHVDYKDTYCTAAGKALAYTPIFKFQREFSQNPILATKLVQMAICRGMYLDKINKLR